MNQKRRARHGVVVVLALALLGSVVATAPSAAQGRIGVQVVESPDFAAEVHHDPWDFVNPEDTPVVIQNLPAGPEYLLPEPVSGSITYPAPNGTQLWLVRNWGTGALATNRDGPLYPIDADRFRRLSMRITVSGTSPVGSGVFWWTCVEQTPDCAGGRPFTLQPGTHVVDLDLTQSGAYASRPAPWAGEVSTLLVTTNGGPHDGEHTRLTIDWVRLYSPTGNPDTDPYPAGWVVADREVVARPRPVLVTPNRFGGEDYSTTVRGRGWDMDTLDDVSDVRNATISVNPLGRIDASSAGPTLNDPVLQFANPAPINTRRWHHLEIRAGYDGRFDLLDIEGGGTMARFVWRNPAAIAGTNRAGFQESNDIIVFPGDNQVLVDLHTDPVGLLTDDEISHRLGWGGPQSRLVTHPEWHPHEDRGLRDWWVWEMRLRRNHLADPIFPIRFRDDAWVPGTVAEVALATERGGPVDHVLVAEMPVTAGENTVTLDSADLAYQHVYWVRLRLRSPNGSTTTVWSIGPVETGTPVEFVDVVPGDQFFDDVFWAVKADIANGYTPDVYGATRAVSRQAMAAFVHRLVNPGVEPAPCTSAPFSDVAITNPFCGHIAWLVDSGIAAGYGDGTYRPTASVSRQAMAAFLANTAHPGGRSQSCLSDAHPDVAADHVFCDAISWLGRSGVTTVGSGAQFNPSNAVSRQALAAFVHRYHRGVGTGV